MDGTTRAMVHGKLCYPRIGWDTLPSNMQNHKSWDVAAVKVELRAKMAVYFSQGAAEYVFPFHPLPSVAVRCSLNLNHGVHRRADGRCPEEGPRRVPAHL